MSVAEQLRAALDRRAAVAHEQNAIIEADAPGAEDLERWDRLDAEFRSLSTQIERLQTQLQRNLALTTVVRDTPAGAPAAQRANDQGAEYREAFDRYVRFGMGEVSPEQRAALQRGANPLAEARALGTLTGPIGGYAVADVFLAELQRTMLYFGGMLQVAEVVRTATGASMAFPTLNDTSNTGRLIGENVAVTQTDISFGQKNLEAYLYSSDAVLVPYTLLQDTALPLESILASALGERLGRIFNTHLTTGTGSSQPEGLVTAATTGKTGATGEATSIKYDSVIDLIHSVDAAYRSTRARFMMHDLSLAVFRKVKDGNGTPIFQLSYQAGEPDRILGYPVTVNNDMAQMAANAYSVAFGDFNRAYLVRMVQDISLIRAAERWVDSLQVGFFAFARMDGILRDANAVKLYRNSAS